MSGIQENILREASIDGFNILLLQLEKQVNKQKISGRDINNALMDF